MWEDPRRAYQLAFDCTSTLHLWSVRTARLLAVSRRSDRCRSVFTVFEASKSSKFAQTYTVTDWCDQPPAPLYRQCTLRGATPLFLAFLTVCDALEGLEVQFFMIFAAVPSFSHVSHFQVLSPVLSQKRPASAYFWLSSRHRSAARTFRTFAAT